MTARQGLAQVLTSKPWLFAHKFPASLLPLLNEWRDLPAKFFEQWVLAENVESGLHSVGAIQSESTVGESQTRSMAMIFREQILQMRKLISRKQDDNIRWIFHNLFFYDLLESFATATENKCFLRGRIQTSLAAKVYQQITGDAGLSGPVDDIVAWAKVGYVFHLSGKELGNGALFLFADHFCKNK